jgi:hypothetical protein
METSNKFFHFYYRFMMCISIRFGSSFLVACKGGSNLLKHYFYIYIYMGYGVIEKIISIVTIA